jgi:hypothetical protein
MRRVKAEKNSARQNRSRRERDPRKIRSDRMRWVRGVAGHPENTEKLNGTLVHQTLRTES